MVVLGSLCQLNCSPIPTSSSYSCSILSSTPKGILTRRRTILLGQSLVVTSLLQLCNPIFSPPSFHLATAQQQQDELQQEEDRLVHLFEGATEFWARLGKYIWSMQKEMDFTRKERLLAMIQNMISLFLRPVVLGTSRDSHVGQSCFAIGNPYGYENTLTTGVVSSLGREIPSPNGSTIRGAIQPDAAIDAGNSSDPLIDSYGHVIGVNTATSTRKGTSITWSQLRDTN